jgi:hypothetical protein
MLTPPDGRLSTHSGNCGRPKAVVAVHESRTLAGRAGEIMLRDTPANLAKTMAAFPRCYVGMLTIGVNIHGGVARAN